MGGLLLLGAGFGLARWMGQETTEVPVVSAATGQTPVVGLGEPHRIVGAEAPDPGGFLGRPGERAEATGTLAKAPRIASTKAGPRTSAAGTSAGSAEPPGGTTPDPGPEPPAPGGSTPAGSTPSGPEPGGPGPEPGGTPDPAAPTEPEEPEGPEGQLDTRAVIFVVRHFLPQVRSCYERQLRNEPELRGQVTVRFTIGAGGRVIDSAPVMNSTGSDPLAACVAATVRTWRFPEPEGGAVAFEYPFRFGNREAAPSLPGPTGP